MKNTKRMDKAYDFFYKAEKEKRRFTLEEVAAVAGWAIQTVRTYQSKKWHKFLHMDGDCFFCEGIVNYPRNSFYRLHSQRTDDDILNLRPRFGERIDALVDKARESALLAVQAYNNPLTTFRTPAYLVLMNIAFTALFHAIFEREGIDYCYKNPDGSPKIIDGDEAGWELSACAAHYYKGQQLPEQKNLEFLIRLRNKIEHRFLPQLDITVAAHCQAMLFNFESLLTKEFGAFFALGQSLALAIQFSQIAPFQREAIKRTQSKEYDIIRVFIDDYQRALPPEVAQSMQYAFRVYLIPNIGNRISSSDIAVEFVSYDPAKLEEMGQLEKLAALIKERQVQVANQGKLKPSQVIKLVTQATGICFNLHLHTNAWKLYYVRPNKPGPQGCKAEYCQYDEPHQDFVYTDKWVQFLVRKVMEPVEYEKIKSYREPRKSSKRQK